MKAVRIHEFGGPEVLKIEDIPVPKPNADELLVKVYATSVNPVDWKIREGMRKDKFPSPLPLTLGWDLAGVVAEVGSDVKNFKKGDEIYARPDPTRNGTYAEYIVVRASEVALKPKTLSFTEAAAVPLAGLTAWQGLFKYGWLQEGQRVLIHAASGGVGTFAVQFAKWRGAYVIGTASEKNIDLVKELGADEVIDYKKVKFEDKLKDIDLVFDTQGGDTQKRSLAVLKNGGRLITTVKPENEAEAKEINIHIEGYMAQSDPKDLQQIAQLIDERKVRPVIAKVMDLDDAKEAQRMSQEGHVAGKIVLKVI